MSIYSITTAERFSSDNKSDFIIIKIISKNHIRFGGGGGVGWLVGLILISRLKLLFAMLMFIPTRERREKRGVFELSVSQVIEDAPGGNDRE